MLTILRTIMQSTGSNFPPHVSSVVVVAVVAVAVVSVVAVVDVPVEVEVVVEVLVVEHVPHRTGQFLSKTS